MFQFNDARAWRVRGSHCKPMSVSKLAKQATLAGRVAAFEAEDLHLLGEGHPSSPSAHSPGSPGYGAEAARPRAPTLERLAEELADLSAFLAIFDRAEQEVHRTRFAPAPADARRGESFERTVRDLLERSRERQGRGEGTRADGVIGISLTFT